MSEIIAAIITLLSTSAIWQFVDNIRYRRENKELKKIEVASNNYTTQSQGLNLVEEFYEKVKKITDEQNNSLKNELTIITKRLDDLQKEQSLEREFLNGQYKEFLKNKGI